MAPLLAAKSKKPLPSSSSSDEVEPPPAKNLPSPAPAADQGNAGSGSDEEEDEGESSEEEPAKRQGAHAGSHPKDGDESESSDEESGDDDEGESSEEQAAEHGALVKNHSAAVTTTQESSAGHARAPPGPARPSAVTTKKNPPPPAPAPAHQGNGGTDSDDEHGSGSSEESDDDDEAGGSSEELGEHGTPVKNLSVAVAQPKKSSAGRAMVPLEPARPSAVTTKKNPAPPAPVPAHKGNGSFGSDDEHGSESSDDDDDEGESFEVRPRQNEAGEPDGMPLEPTSQMKENVPPAEVTKQPQKKRKALAAESAELPEAAIHAEAEEQLKSDAEQLEEKLASYEYLGQEVMALETNWHGMFKESFLNDPDDKIRALDTKVKKQRLAEFKVRARRDYIDKDVKKTLIDLLN